MNDESMEQDGKEHFHEEFAITYYSRLMTALCYCYYNKSNRFFRKKDNRF